MNGYPGLPGAACPDAGTYQESRVMAKKQTGFLPAALVTGEAEMDVQHEQIFGSIESLKTLAFETNTLPVEKVHALIDFLAEHFATEERLAQAAKIEFLVHGQEHARNLRLLKKAVGELENGKLDRHTFLRYIEYWFEQHIADFDKRFAARLVEAKKQP